MFVHATFYLFLDTLRRLVNGNYTNNNNPKHVELIEEPKPLKSSPKPSPATSDHRKQKKLKSSMQKLNGGLTESPSNNSTESKGSENSTINSVSPKSSSKFLIIRRYWMVHIGQRVHISHVMRKPVYAI